MKTILSLRKHLYWKRVSIFLIVIALIAGIIGCEGSCGGGNGGVTEYTLTMAVNPVGGGTATDLTGTSPYPASTNVSIQAVANPGYEFVNWTSSAGGTFTNQYAATTTFTMPAQNVTVTANFVLVYDLTMAVNPVGGGTATDLTGTSPYPASTGVSVQAVANPGYTFVKWTAPAGAFTDENAATTTFTMPAQDVTATAHFVGPPDHFKFYWVDGDTAPYIGEDVQLLDQFGAFNATVEYAMEFGNPVKKKVYGEEPSPISNPDHHLALYTIDCGGEYVVRSVEVSNQFGYEQQLNVYGPVALAVPTQKLVPGGHEEPVGLNHYLLYGVDAGTPVGISVNLTDQFSPEPDPDIWVYEPIYFANPVQKTVGENVTEIWDPTAHLVFYYIDSLAMPTSVQVYNQFDNQTLNLLYSDLLAVPSEKIVPPVPPLDHFKCYDVLDTLPIDTYVYLEDQFGYYEDVQVMEADWFCNPVIEKVHNEVPTLVTNPDNHLMVYNITGVSQAKWVVVVSNQFDLEFPPIPQTLIVNGPVALAVPTQKLVPGDHLPPKYLDHFLLYEVIIGDDVGATVEHLEDQFGLNLDVSVAKPVYFANPVLVKDHGGNITLVWDPEAHLVFYDIDSWAPLYPSLLVNNQFGDLQSYELDALEPRELLAAPSEKVYYEPYGGP